jgi:hypothetical protein
VGEIRFDGKRVVMRGRKAALIAASRRKRNAHRGAHFCQSLASHLRTQNRAYLWVIQQRVGLAQ